MQDEKRISLRELATYWDDREIGGKLGPYGLVHWYALRSFNHSLTHSITRNLLHAQSDELEEILGEIIDSLEAALELTQGDQGLRAELLRTTQIVLDAERMHWSDVEQQVDRRLEQISEFLFDIRANVARWIERSTRSRQGEARLDDSDESDLYQIISSLIWSYHFVHSTKLEYGENSVLLTWLPEIQLLSQSYGIHGTSSAVSSCRLYPSVQLVIEQGDNTKLFQLLAASLRLGSVAHSQTPCLGYVKVAEQGSSGFRQLIGKGGFVAGPDRLGSKDLEGMGSSEWSDLFYFNRSAFKLNILDEKKSLCGRIYICSVLDSHTLKSLLSWLVRSHGRKSDDQEIHHAVQRLWSISGPGVTHYLRDSIGNLVRLHHQVNEQSKSLAEAAIFQEIKGELDGLIQIDQQSHILLQRIQEKLRRVSRGFLRYYDEIKELFQDKLTFHYRLDSNNHVVDIGKVTEQSRKIEASHGPPRNPSIWVDYASFIHIFGRSRHNRFLEVIPVAISLVSLAQADACCIEKEVLASDRDEEWWLRLLERHRRKNADWNQKTIVQGFYLLKWALQKAHGKTELLHPYQLIAAVLARMTDDQRPYQRGASIQCNICISLDSGVQLEQDYQASGAIDLIRGLCQYNTEPPLDGKHSAISEINEGKSIPLAKIPDGMRPADVMDALMRLLRIELAHSDPEMVRLQSLDIRYLCHMDDCGQDGRESSFLEMRIFCHGFFTTAALSKLRNLADDAGNHGLRSCFDILCRSANQLMPEIVESLAQTNNRGVWILRERAGLNGHADGDQILLRWPLDQTPG